MDTLAEHSGQVEQLLLCGVPPRMVAARLSLSVADLTRMAHSLRKSGAVERYQLECLKRVEGDNYPDEAAVYLYIRGVSAPRIRVLFALPADYEFDVNEKYAYQQKLIDKVATQLKVESKPVIV